MAANIRLIAKKYFPNAMRIAHWLYIQKLVLEP
jgi:hypothetical protein